ncbi:Alpha/Beta hydrolase protein [Hypoxylon fragiforme]|uniref:Alpha/Beta hydrolase protein n=1 Tax=Hypoxylon fragiforme TaxID=63214 RepID=UPI0020C64BC5|nr:Alpha/Beta hydrolase protein [Hypoxylon fragiforme]KAI2614386.1 Alpha/Beta hydrolase protein [Hypoxylon fragiforme]
MVNDVSDAGDSITSLHIGQSDGEADCEISADKGPEGLHSANASAVRTGANFISRWANRFSSTATETIWLDSTLGEWRGKEKIRVDVWRSAQSPESPRLGKRPAIINFHGGGFVFGEGTDDVRWADALVAGLDAVVFSVNYRLAPTYPFPAPVEDCIDAILQIFALGDRYNVEANRIILTGFSVGATLAMSSWIVLQEPKRWSYQLPSLLPRIAGIVLYCPLLDCTIDRSTKREACPRPDLTLPSGLTDLSDASYLRSVLLQGKRDDLRLSPGLMPAEMLDQLPPIHMCMCEYDMALAEGHAFEKRMMTGGKPVSVRVVDGERDAWDKPPPIEPKKSVALEYGKAIELISTWLGNE